ncbi:sodium:glutamate symporter [Brachyspira aalborgi]|uniref:Sodium:glutamate symporter n=1 Tax=Brachyspira aalborgi TaxID=29522 RepID=A0A5C8E1Z7_9SPIR|nr:sodium/glutamate symporter [Brachyspira aalborgi]TXJ31730.1 sodium:glutamate symporter [Brachyspira aalborgi]TXJ60759.1 sodium:glutamate symporter [Brachyspira aalborgi]
MTSQLLTQLLQALSLLSVLLLAGTFLRAKVKLFQSLYLPASVIGGFIGMIISPEILGRFSNYSISEEWIKTYSLLPGILSVPIFAAIPLGMFLNENKNIKSMYPSKVLICFGLFQCASMSQSAIGYATNMFFSKINPQLNMYRTFGYELSAGFAGGHGLAAATGKLLEGFGIPQWEIAQGVALTTATIGLIGGIVFGIIFINLAVRKNKTKIIKRINDNADKSMEVGYNKDINKQNSLGRETFLSSSIETITFHLAIIFTVCGIAYIVLNFVKKMNIAGLNVLPVWTYSMIIMFALNFIIKKLNLVWMVDAKVKAKIMGTLSDFAIVSAMTSLPIKAIINYIAPITVMCILGFIITYLLVFPLNSFFFKEDYSFERAIISWGTLTGVLITGMTLLKICDPEYKSPALSEFSLGFSLMSVTGLLIVPILNTVLAVGSTFDNFITAIISAILYFAFAFMVSFINKKSFTKN